MDFEKKAQSIQKTMHSIHEGYQIHFSGHPRISRNVNQLSAWIVRLKEVKPMLRLLPSHLKKEIQTLYQSRLDLYTKEQKAIIQLQKLNQESQMIYHMMMWNQFNDQRYHLHFAGQSRSTRDLSFLSELIVDVKVWKCCPKN